MYIIYSFIGSFLALVVYNLFGGKQFVEKKIKESKEQKEENQLRLCTFSKKLYNMSRGI